MTDLLTFIEATKGTSLKIEVTSKARTCWNSQMPSLKGQQQRQERKSSGRAMSNTFPRRRLSIFWACVMRPYGIGLGRRVFYRRTIYMSIDRISYDILADCSAKGDIIKHRFAYPFSFSNLIMK